MHLCISNSNHAINAPVTSTFTKGKMFKKVPKTLEDNPLKPLNTSLTLITLGNTGSAHCL